MSEYGRTPDEVKDEIKLAMVKQAVENSDSEYVLILDSHRSILLGRPNDLLQAAESLKADYVYIAEVGITQSFPVFLEHSINGA